MKRLGRTYWIMSYIQLAVMAVLVVVFLLSGCASSILLEAEHVSHPLVGWPVTSQSRSEDGLSTASAMLHWDLGEHGYLDLGLGVNLEGRNGGGFYGPWLTGGGRIGYEIPLR